MSKIAIDILGAESIDTLLSIANSFDDLSEPMNEVAAIMEGATEDAFADEASPVTGERWEALSDNYLKANPKRVGGQILQASAGGLAASIEADSGVFWAEIGSNKPYAAIHNFGGTSDMAPGPAAIPAREYFGINAENEDDILKVIESFLVKS